MTVLEQVTRRQVTAHLGVESHLVADKAVNEAARHHIGNRQLREDLEQVGVGRELVGHDDEQAIDPTVHKQAHQLGVVGRRVVGVGDEQGIPTLAAPDLEVLGKRGEEAVLDVGNDEPERMGVLGHE